MKALLLVAAGLFAVGSLAVPAAADAPARDISMPGRFYDPANATVLVGTTVTWRNRDSINHTVTADGDAFDSGYVAPGGSFSFTFAREGRYAYHCVIHRLMKAEIDVFSLVLTGPEDPVGYGRQVVIAGLAPPGTKTVVLSRAGAREPVRTAVPRPDGSFTLRFRADEPGTYRAAAGAARSPLVRVRVVPRVAIAVGGGAVRVSAEPARPGARVVLQEYVRDLFAWRTVRRARLDAGSRARLALPERPVRVRVVVRGESGWSDAVSRTLVLRR